ncbi:MAG: pyrroline-5-carboxylate reductase [Nitrospinae bacterium]|nr:pyrroline-5-carboxylate reductase [Nitrospinota bacterium]
MLKKKNVAFIGAGNMAEALIKGLLKADFIDPKNIWASDIRTDRLDYLRGLYKIKTTTDNSEAVQKVDIVILAVKPQILSKVVRGIIDVLDEPKLIISIAAGVPISAIQKVVDRKLRIIRAMPNTPALVQEGATALAYSENASQEDIKIAQQIFDAVGKTVIVDEDLIDAVTGLSGSGPAYIFLIIDSLADAGVKMGLSRDISMILSVQTVLGAAKLVLETGKHPGQLKDMVTSPGGTAIAGLHTLEEGGLRTTMINAVEVATLKSKELGRNQT